MAREADFSETTKTALAKRVGYKCSFPGCPTMTVGPSAEGPEATSSSGMACHIYAASDGPAARRRNPQLSLEELRAIENGIWMCYTHGKVIDTDECTYTPAMLRHWRFLAEKRAHIHQITGKEPALVHAQDPDIFLLNLRRELVPGANINREIGEVYLESCVREIWGADLAHAIRELTIELARNAFVHGGASRFSVEVERHKITLRDDGAAFSLGDLGRHYDGRGGAAAAREITERFNHTLICSYIRHGSENLTILAYVSKSEQIKELTPCSLELPFGAHDSKYAEAIEFCETHRECGTVYLVPKHGISHSDIWIIAQRFGERPDITQKIVIVCEGVSSGLERYVRETASNVSIMQFHSTRP